MGKSNGSPSMKHKPKPAQQSKQPQVVQPSYKREPTYTGQPMIRVDLSPARLHGCSATEFLAWVRQQEGRV
jgi:hypothetical protein